MIVWNLEVANLGAKRDSQGAQSLQSAIDVRPGHRQQFGSLLVFVLSYFGIYHCVFVQLQPAIDWVSLICWVVALSVLERGGEEFLSRLTDLFSTGLRFAVFGEQSEKGGGEELRSDLQFRWLACLSD